MKAFLLKDDKIVNAVEYSGELPEFDGGLRVVAARDDLSLGDVYSEPQEKPVEHSKLEDDVELLKQQIAELQSQLKG